MIFATVGTNEAPFDRLLEAVAALPPGRELVVQHGPSSVRPAGARCVDYLDYDALVAEVRRAEVVVTHAGVGSVITSLAHGHRPVVLPRLTRYGEAVDDHQLEFARRAAAAGLVTLIEDPGDLAGAIVEEGAAPISPLRPDPRLVDELRGYLDAAVSRRYSR